ncbi:hypothetical protein [Streptomyces milbemycinicus]|uniref:hypothetical protein n=1 Tax=Streptomyces milbemycinicus TaxID=476552 RepID=UPI001180C7BD|nr:hypothetical protein [Streptomyces milbemycinicus]
MRDRLSGLREELERIREQIGEAEDRLHRLTITRETLESLGTDPQSSGTPDAPGVSREPEGASASSTSAPEELPRPAGAGAPAESVGPLEWEEGRRRMLSLLATAGRALRAREIAGAIGEDVSTPARVETTRGRLKRLAEEGHVAEDPVGWFAICAANSAVGGEETAGEG